MSQLTPHLLVDPGRGEVVLGGGQRVEAGGEAVQGGPVLAARRAPAAEVVLGEILPPVSQAAPGEGLAVQVADLLTLALN